MEERVYENLTRSLSIEEAEKILLNPQKEIIREPPVKPKAGNIYIYLNIVMHSKQGLCTKLNYALIIIIMPFSDQVDNWKCYQYRWYNNGCHKLPRSGPRVKKVFYKIDLPDGPSGTF